MRREQLRLEQVCLREQGLVCLEDFSLEVYEGEIMGLLAVNSHGLTALIRLLQNNLPLERGYVYYRGRQINSWRAPRPAHNRIGVIQRESSLVDDLTVAENMFVLRRGCRTHIIRTGMLRQQLRRVAEETGAAFPVDAYANRLRPFERCMVELAKAVMTGCHLVVLRDVSTIVSESELAQLHEMLRQYTAKGISFLYIGFHMEELNQICDRIAVLDNGCILKVLHANEPLFHCADDYFARVQEHRQWAKTQPLPQKPVLEMRQLSSGAIRGLSFAVSAGECLTLQDLSNRVFPDLRAVLRGEQAIASGEMLLGGAPLTPQLTREIAILPELPCSSMLFHKMSYLDNLCFTMDHRMPELWRRASVQKGLKKACIEQFGDDLFDVQVENLTRAQQYDLIYRRVLLQKPKVVFCIQPFLGADKALRMRIFDLLKSLLHHGIAVVILAVNLADALSLSDRLIRIHGDGTSEVYGSRDFADLPFIAPFREIYEDK